MRKFIVYVGMTVTVLWFPAAFLLFGGVIFGANIEPYILTIFTGWSIYVLGWMLGLVTEETL